MTTTQWVPGCVSCTSQGLLTCLLPAGTAPQDGAVAHVCVNGWEMTCTWQAGAGAGGGSSGAWHVQGQEQQPASEAPSMTLLQATGSVARLPGAASGCDSSLCGHHHPPHHHRVSLLLHLEPAGRHVSFVSSDAEHLQQQQQLPCVPGASTGSDDVVVHCVAHGPWGVSLPVTVVHADITRAAAGEEGEERLQCDLTVSKEHAAFFPRGVC
jgi:hypothetical protein